MEAEGKVQFLKYHQGSVRGVAFHPKDRYLFCSGAYDGKVNLYSACKCQHLRSFTVSSVSTASLARNVNAVRFTCDGSKILATTTARRLAVIDVEKGDQVHSYDNCAFNGHDRTGLAADPVSPQLVVCCCVNGKGLALFDLRMPLPLDFLYDTHSGIIRDLIFLNESWPWCNGQRAVLSVGDDALCKIMTVDGRCMHAIDLGQPLNSVAATPEPFDSATDDGFCSLLMFAGKHTSAYLPGQGIQEVLTENKEAPIWKIKYNTHGSLLYTACDRGVVRRYCRWPDRHSYLEELYRHKGDIEDMDISPYDEYLVTASKDRTVGVMKLGGPNHGASEYSELT